MCVTGNGSTKAAERSRYTHEAELKFQELSAKLAGIRKKTKSPVAAGRLDTSDQLAKAEYQAEKQLAIVQRTLGQLKGANNESWQFHKRDLETGWEDLMRSIKNLVSRIS